ncbi:MAG TPA: hypothetical protein VN956_11910 [Pyrinomonadaceae bacterium]|nr:hypothetical protein [Pyrinomonadaceae bacterium]
MKNNLPLKIIVSVLGILAAIVHAWKPELRVDSVTIILLVIAALPWAQPLIKSIELLGVKLELQELQDKVAEAKGAAESATRQVGLALAASSQVPQTAAADERGVANEINSLAEEYNNIRATQSSGDARTDAMTRVVSRMVEVARRTQSFDLVTALAGKDRGVRLFAYAFLYERPDGAFLLPLVDSVTRIEDKPFGQYWGLQTLKKVLPLAPADKQRGAKESLRAFSERIPSGTDRDYELRQLLR